MAAFLLAIAAALTARVLVSLGIGIAVYVGLDNLINDVVSKITVHLNSIPADYLQIISLAGITEALSIGLGALSMAATLLTLKKFRIL